MKTELFDHSIDAESPSNDWLCLYCGDYEIDCGCNDFHADYICYNCGNNLIVGVDDQGDRCWHCDSGDIEEEFDRMASLMEMDIL